MPFSVRLIVMLLTVLSDLPICVAISFCVAFGRSCKKFSTAISSKVQNLHFGRDVWRQRQSTWVLNCRFCRLISILSRNNLTVVCNGLVLSGRCLSDSRLLFPNFECHDSKTILALRSFTGQQYFGIVFAVIDVKHSVI